MINILLADDQKLIREGIKMILSLYDDINIIGEAENGQDLLELLDALIPDIILLDIRMPLIDGIESAKIIKEKYKSIKIIILTSFNDDAYFFGSIKNGVDGYLLKDADSDTIIKAIRDVHNGEMYLSPSITSKLVHAFNSLSKESLPLTYTNKFTLEEILSPREIDVAKLIALGKNNKYICQTLYLTEGTVKNYVSKILEKLNLKNRTELALYINNLIKNQ